LAFATRAGNACSKFLSWVGGQVVVEEDKRGLGRFRDCGNLYDLAFAY
jgi:hypothetical protein